VKECFTVLRDSRKLSQVYGLPFLVHNTHFFTQVALHNVSLFIHVVYHCSGCADTWTSLRSHTCYFQCFPFFLCLTPFSAFKADSPSVVKRMCWGLAVISVRPYCYGLYGQDHRLHVFW